MKIKAYRYLPTIVLYATARMLQGKIQIILKEDGLTMGSILRLP